MARQVGADEKDAQSGIGISKPRLKVLLAKLRSNRGERTEINEARRALLDAAIDKDHAHKGATLLIEKLDKMEAVKRAEYLYHFDLARGHMGWDTSDLLRKETSFARAAREVEADEGEPLPA